MSSTCLKCGNAGNNSSDGIGNSIFLCRWCEGKLFRENDYSHFSIHRMTNSVRLKLARLGLNVKIGFTSYEDRFFIFIGLSPTGVTVGMWEFAKQHLIEDGYIYRGRRMTKEIGIAHVFEMVREPLTVEEIYQAKQEAKSG